MAAAVAGYPDLLSGISGTPVLKMERKVMQRLRWVNKHVN